MSMEFTPVEVAKTCPVVLLADEMIMVDRIAAANEAANSQPARAGDLVGYMMTDDGPQAAFAPDGVFTSRRKLSNESGADDRIVRPTPLGMYHASGDYTILADDFMTDTSSVSSMFRRNAAPITKAATEELPFVVFQSYPPTEPTMTRGGFLGSKGDGTIGPYSADYRDKKYLVEVKGCGNARGGFTTMTDQFFCNVVLGGLSMTDAVREAQNLERAHDAGLTPIVPLAIGEITLNDGLRERFGRLGVVFKLSPSTIRLSYADTQLSVTPQNPAEARMISNKLLTNFLDKFFLPSDAPVFISPASHLENYLVTDGITLTETDFEDFRELGSGDFPFVHTQTAHFMDTRLSIEHYFTNFSRVDQFDRQDYRSVAAATQRFLGLRGVEVDLTTCSSMEEIASTLWSEWLTEKEHVARLEQGYRPTAMLDFFAANRARLQEVFVPENAATLQELQDQVDADADMAVTYGNLAAWLPSYNRILTSDGRQNKYRYADTGRNAITLNSMVANELQQLGVAELPDLVLSAFEASRAEYELATRIFGGVQFFNEWMRSEVASMNVLISNGHTELSHMRNMLSKMADISMEVMESSKPMDAIRFSQVYLPRYLEQIDEIYSLMYEQL